MIKLLIFKPVLCPIDDLDEQGLSKAILADHFPLRMPVNDINKVYTEINQAKQSSLYINCITLNQMI